MEYFILYSLQCAEKLGIHYEPIKNCSTTEMGNKLEHEMAVVTNNLNPPHKYVPWVTLNGVSSVMLHSLFKIFQDNKKRVF